MLALSADILNGSDTVSLSILQNILLPKKNEYWLAAI